MNSGTMAVTVFGETGELSVRELKRGTRVSIMSRKAFGETRGLKGQELKRRYSEYQCEAGVRGNQAVGSMMTGGEILLQSFVRKTDKDGVLSGYQANFVPASAVDTSADPVLSAGKLTTAQLKKMVAEREAREVAPEKAPETVPATTTPEEASAPESN